MLCCHTINARSLHTFEFCNSSLNKSLSTNTLSTVPHTVRRDLANKFTFKPLMLCRRVIVTHWREIVCKGISYISTTCKSTNCNALLFWCLKLLFQHFQNPVLSFCMRQSCNSLETSQHTSRWWWRRPLRYWALQVRFRSYRSPDLGRPAATHSWWDSMLLVFNSSSSWSHQYF